MLLAPLLLLPYMQVPVKVIVSLHVLVKYSIKLPYQHMASEITDRPAGVTHYYNISAQLAVHLKTRHLL